MPFLTKKDQLARSVTEHADHRLAKSVSSHSAIPENTTQCFDPDKHLAFEMPPKILMMKDIGYAADTGVSPVAVTHPFQLFSPEAIRIMRSEIDKQEVIKNHSYSSNIANAQRRGYAREHAPFTYAAWTHPNTMAIISKLAGIDLVPWSDYEIAHINLSATKIEEQTETELDNARVRKMSSDSGVDVSVDENKPIVGWHHDSYPFVCVLMMSDCTGMIGGETALRTAKGDVLRIRGPTEGCAVILQGRYITHQALRAVGAKERITSVTSWRPRSPFVKDDSVLRTVRPISDLNELYADFTEYRLAIMEQRLQRAREELRARREAGKDFDTAGTKTFLQESEAFLRHTEDELVDEAQVEKGVIELIDMPDVIVRAGK